jgi:hypothetical protein
MTSKERKEARYQRRIQRRCENQRAFIEQYDDFSLVADADNLYQAYRKAKLGVSWKESVQRYSSHWSINILHTLEKLIAGEDISKGFVEFDLRERGKIRHIRSVHISERVVQKCLCDQVLVPILSKSLIYDNAASLKDKGIHFSLRRLIVHMTKFYRSNGFSNKGYALIIDFSKYFDSIRHDILLEKIAMYIKDAELLKLITRFITVFGDNISIGLGSQISQIGAIFYPSKEVDHFIKEKKGIKYYGRYMDDLYLIHKNREYLKECLRDIVAACEKIGIRVNLKKTKIVSLEHGITFLKGRYILNKNGHVIRLPCRSSTVCMNRKLHKFSKLLAEGRMDPIDIYRAYQSWRNTFRRRFDAFYRVEKMDYLYNKLFIGER